MQTFLPYPDFKRSLECLDYRRLGKQRLEARGILTVLYNPESRGYTKHPAVLMWKGFEDALICYHNLCIETWEGRGYKNNMPTYEYNEPFIYPGWFGNERFHDSHKSNLLRKNPEFYGKYGWKVKDDLPYFWPTKDGIIKWFDDGTHIFLEK